MTSTKRFQGVMLAIAAITLVTGASRTHAQSPAAAQALYQQQLAACDPAEPRPAYNACVRAAGLALDRSGVSSSSGVMDESADGRATIVQTPGAPVQSIAPSVVVPQTFTSQDGRATLLVPSDSTIRTGP